MAAELVVEDLVKRFDPVTAVNGISFRVSPGRILVLLGPSGCGKTTILRCIAGLERPDEGRVLLEGREITHLPPEERDIGLVFQHYALFPHMSVASNIAYGLRFGRRRLPPRERRRRVGKLLELVGLEGYERRKPHQLSEGQKQRVALARALAPEPEVLLLDEPLSALDAALRVELRRELRRILKERAITVIYVTHDQEEGLVLADEMAVMREGRIEQIGPPQEIYRDPATHFVASFLGKANLWEGVVERCEGERIFVRVGDRLIEAIGDGKPGERVLLFFRPQDLIVGEGPHEAEVQESYFLGERWEVHATFQGLPLLLFASSPPGSPGIRFAFRHPPRVLPK